MIVHRGRISRNLNLHIDIICPTQSSCPHRQPLVLIWRFKPSFLPKAGAGSLAKQRLHVPPSLAALQTDMVLLVLAGHFVRVLGFGTQLAIKGWVLESVVSRSGWESDVRPRSFVTILRTRSDQLNIFVYVEWISWFMELQLPKNFGDTAHKFLI